VDDVTAGRDERADVRNFWIERRVSVCMFWQVATNRVQQGQGVCKKEGDGQRSPDGQERDAGRIAKEKEREARRRRCEVRRGEGDGWMEAEADRCG
jgi:hypothetical protein